MVTNAPPVACAANPAGRCFRGGRPTGFLDGAVERVLRPLVFGFVVVAPDLLRGRLGVVRMIVFLDIIEYQYSIRLVYYEYVLCQRLIFKAENPRGLKSAARNNRMF